MSITELLPAVYSLPDPDKLQLIRILAEVLTGYTQSPLDHITGGIPVWTPHSALLTPPMLFLRRCRLTISG